MSPPRLRSGLPALLLLLLVGVVFGRSLGNGFVFDDHALVETNPVVRTLNPLEHLARPYWGQRDASQHYLRPLVSWSLALDRLLYGTDPGGYHLTNLVVHWLNAVLLFLLLRGIGGSPGVACAAAALFAVHPVQSEAVSWISGRTDLMATLFMLLAVHAYARFGKRPAPVAAFALATAAALMSKEAAVTLPALLLAYDLATRRGLGRRFVLGCAVASALILAYLLLRHAVLGSALGAGTASVPAAAVPFAGASTTTRLLTAVGVAGRYLWLLVFPLKLSADYRENVVPLVSSLTSPVFLASAAAIAATLLLSVWLSRRQALGVFGSVAAAGTYLLVSHLLFPGPVMMAERLLYLPMVGICALVAAALTELPRRGVRLAGTALLVLLASRSFVRSADWKDDLTLFRATIATTPSSALAFRGLAAEQLKRGDHEAALDSVERGLAVAIDDRELRSLRAEALREVGRWSEARRTLIELTRDHPEYQRAWLGRIQLAGEYADRLIASGQSEEALRVRLAETEAAQDAWPPVFADAAPEARAVFLAQLARNLALLGRDADAGRAYADAVAALDDQVRPDIEAMVLGLSAPFLLDHGQPLLAARQFERAVAAGAGGHDPSAPAGLLLGAGRGYRLGGALDEALDAYRRAELAAGDDARLVQAARRGRADALARGGRVDEALALAGSDPVVLLAVAEAAVESGQARVAIPVFDRLLDLGFEPGRTRFGRGRARRLTGDLDGAEQDLRSALAGETRPRVVSAIRAELAAVAAARAGVEEP